MREHQFGEFFTYDKIHIEGGVISFYGCTSTKKIGKIHRNEEIDLIMFVTCLMKLYYMNEHTDPGDGFYTIQEMEIGLRDVRIPNDEIVHEPTTG